MHSLAYLYPRSPVGEDAHHGTDEFFTLFFEDVSSYETLMTEVLKKLHSE